MTMLLTDVALRSTLLGLLPGVPCRACGYSDCAAFVDAMIYDDIDPRGCVAANPEAIIKIAHLRGKKITVQEKKVAAMLCQGRKEAIVTQFIYQGIASCRAAHELNGGGPACSEVCLGYGDCVSACLFDAIKHRSGDIPVINTEYCAGCGMCVTACPRNVVSMVDAKSKRIVLCQTQATKEVALAQCQKACIGCGRCIEQCPFKAISMIPSGRAIINYDACTNCGICEPLCPTGAIKQHN